MARHLSAKDRLGKRGENVVKLLADQMNENISLIPAEQKTPSIDGILQILDSDHGCFRYINVQIKAGDSHVKNRWGARGAMLYLKPDDIRDWKAAKHPTIVVWVPSDEEKLEAYWRNAQYAKIRANGVKLKTSNKFDKTAFSHLLRLAREHAGISAAPLLESRPLFPKKVREVKGAAWSFYSSWRKEGARNPLLKDIRITLKGWRHITRATLPQPMICHKLSLLSCAKEIVATSQEVRYMRQFQRDGKDICLVRITGALKERHRVTAVVDVVVEKEMAPQSNKAKYTFLSVYERGHL
ncbi:DUF4365 domain-containing protein [soil metagenome]